MVGAVIRFAQRQDVTERLPPQEWSRRLRQWLLQQELLYSPK